MFFTSLLEGNVGKVSDASSSFWRGLIGSAGSTSTGVRVTPESALALPVIQNCVTLLAESLAPDWHQAQGRLLNSLIGVFLALLVALLSHALQQRLERRTEVLPATKN